MDNTGKGRETWITEVRVGEIWMTEVREKVTCITEVREVVDMDNRGKGGRRYG